MQSATAKILKAIFILGLAVCGVLFFIKDRLPPPSFYDASSLGEPHQQPTMAERFTTRVNDENYVITPRFDYELEGVVVSYHDADDFTDIWHHARWKDFINLRDLCVIWGENVGSGVYREMTFHNDSWTCWAAWPNRETGRRFRMGQLSNNHVLIDDPAVRRQLMQAEPGDHIRLRGMLVDYSNPRSKFYRSTSTTRSDTGNGACETVYVTEFELLRKANPSLRGLYRVSKWLVLISLAGLVLMFFFAPYRGRYARNE